jgi:hypothetical protein
MITVETQHGRFDIMPKWRGQFVAVHRRITTAGKNGVVFTSNSRDWQITHAATGKGMASCRLYGCTLDVVLRLAVAWDDAIGEIDASAPREWSRLREWAEACRVAYRDGIVLSPKG